MSSEKVFLRRRRKVLSWLFLVPGAFVIVVVTDTVLAAVANGVVVMFAGLDGVVIVVVKGVVVAGVVRGGCFGCGRLAVFL